jgi:hypothetical protein
MIDFFDSDVEWSSGAAAPRAREYEVLAEGVHDLEIVAASVGPVAWKASTSNIEGECLRLRLSAGRGISYVFADIPRHRTFLFKALAASLGLEPGPDGKVRMVSQDELIGRTVRCEIGNYATKAGETRANVRRWLPAAGPRSTASAPQAPPAPSTVPKLAPCRTQATKAAAAFKATADDDAFPF